MDNLGPIDVIHDQIQRKLERQIRNFEILDAKAGIIMGIAVLVLTKTSLLESLAGKICIITSIGSFLMGLISLQVRTLRTDPDPKRLAHEYLQYTAERIKSQLISNMVESFEFNARVLRQKAWLLRIAINSAILSIILYLGVLYV